MESSRRGAWSSRATGAARELITEEEKLAWLSGCKEVVYELNHLWLGKKVFQQSGVVIPTKVECLLQFGCKPPMPLIHAGNPSEGNRC